MSAEQDTSTVDEVDAALRDEGYATWPGDDHIALRAESAGDERAKRRISRLVEPLGWTCLEAGLVLRCEPL